MSSRTEGLRHKYDVQRTDGKPLKGGRAIVLEVGDPNAHPALLTWADTVDARGYQALADDVRFLVSENTMPNKGIDYDGPGPTVECAYPPCTNRLRRIEGSGTPGSDHPQWWQWCSKEHRALTPTAGREADDGR